mgnify:CR=1 FL=1
MRNTLICTIGTSLLGHISRDETLKPYYESQNWQGLVLKLLEYGGDERICGAEINSITSIHSKSLIETPVRLIFLVSDTDGGKTMGEILKLYYENSKNPIRYESVELRSLQGLKDSDVKQFKTQGLKNLVREISQEVGKYTAECVAINATGGYKAQISFAGMIGQALGIPVYYLFEKFSEVIELPPQPIALDLAFWLQNYTIFETLEVNNLLDESEMNQVPEITGNWEALLDAESIDGKMYYTLSAMGSLFHAQCRQQFKKQEQVLLSLVPQSGLEPSQKAISLRDDHGKDVLLSFAKKLVRSPYVTKIVNSLPFNSKQRNCILDIQDNGGIDFVLTWTDKGLGLHIQTTGRNRAETATIALHLENEFGQ